MKIEIKCRFSGSVLFSHDCEGNTIRTTLEVAVAARANLDGAYLAGANLAGANLDGAYLAGANLDGAYLAGAYLAGAYLAGAYLARANLDGAYLAGANLDGAYLAGANLAGGEILKGERPILQIGPIGSRCAYFSAFLTDKGLRLRAGCFFGSREEFEEQLAETHDGNEHSKEYKAALAMIDCHAEIWTPKEGE
jgi:Pentapeptide repeats (8 copies)